MAIAPTVFSRVSVGLVDSAQSIIDVDPADTGPAFGIDGTWAQDGTTVTATAAELNYNDIATLGTGAASKAVVLDSGDDYTWPAAGILTYGVLNDGTTALGATALELNSVADASARLVTLTGATTITAALHAGRICLLGEVGGDASLTVTLPAAAATGNIYRFIVSVVNTSNYVIQVVVNDTMDGSIVALQDAADTLVGWETAADSDTITLNGTTQGGVSIGDWVELIDIATDQWAVSGTVTASGTEVTPFSAAVS